MQTKMSEDRGGRDPLVSSSSWIRVRNEPPWDDVCSTGAEDYLCHSNTQFFFYSFGGTPRSHIRIFSFFPLSLLCCHCFIFSHCKILCKCWALHYNSCEQGEMLLSTCQGAVLHRIIENSVGKSSSALISRMGSAPPNLLCLPCPLLKNGRTCQTSAFNPSYCFTIPKLENYIPNFPFTSCWAITARHTYLFFFAFITILSWLPSVYFFVYLTIAVCFSFIFMYFSSLLTLTALIWKSSNWAMLFLTPFWYCLAGVWDWRRE